MHMCTPRQGKRRQLSHSVSWTFMSVRQMIPTCQCSCQEADMSSLVRRNLLQVCVKGCVETNGSELLLGEVCQTLTVELVLEMLQSESVVEDISWWMMLAISVSQARGSRDHTVGYGRCLSLCKRSGSDNAGSSHNSNVDLRKLHDGDEWTGRQVE